MARYIDADALIDFLDETVPYDEMLVSQYNADWIYSFIESAPTVDAVEVVRCKDCIHWYEPEEVCLKIYSDGAVSQYAWQNRNPDDYCSYGERKVRRKSDDN